VNSDPASIDRSAIEIFILKLSLFSQEHSVYAVHKVRVLISRRIRILASNVEVVISNSIKVTGDSVLVREVAPTMVHIKNVAVFIQDRHRCRERVNHCAQIKLGYVLNGFAGSGVLKRTGISGRMFKKFQHWGKGVSLTQPGPGKFVHDHRTWL
jgi:hypothetical protein